MKRIAGWAVGLLLSAGVHAGPYAPAAGQGQPGSTAVSKDSAAIAGWASGFLDYLPGPNVDATWKTPEKALGAAVGDSFDIVALGDSGRITLTFQSAIFDGPGADFAVFENGFSDAFLELAWVEVSSNGTDFFRFPGFSLTASPVGQFGTIDPTNIDGLAGKYKQGYGTPFDLADLVIGGPVPGLDVNSVRYVRIVDILGDGSVLDSFPNNPIYDPTPTVGSGGFDLDAVGVMHLAPVPEPAAYLMMGAGLLLLGLAARRRSARAVSTSARPTSWTVVSTGALLALSAANAPAVTVTFDDLPLTPQSHYFPAATTTFTSAGAVFHHNYTNYGPTCCWDGWTYSNTTDTTTAGAANQYSAFTGGGLDLANYGVAFIGYAAPPAIEFATPSLVSSASFTNTTYAALSMLDGDSFAKKFGGASGNDPDYFKLTIVGRDAASAVTGTVEVYLADYRFANNADDYLLRTWTAVDLSALGAVSRLEFGLASSDNGAFGMNTPAYFAMDDLTVTAVPEPELALLLPVGFAFTLLAARRRRKTRCDAS